MRIMYIILIILALGLLIFSLICMEMITTYAGQSEDASSMFSIVSSVVEAFALIVGFLGIRNVAKTSYTLILSSVAMLFWSILMFQKPTHIGMEEVVLFWWLYILGIIILSFIGYRNYEEKFEDDGILDSGM